MILKWYLAEFKWYRKRKGGIWHKVQVRIPEYWIYWTKNPCCVETVLKTEDYATLKIPFGSILKK